VETDLKTNTGDVCSLIQETKVFFSDVVADLTRKLLTWNFILFLFCLLAWNFQLMESDVTLID
jgi:hypothetical protein